MFFNSENFNQRVNATFKELTSLWNLKSIVSNMKTSVFLSEKPRQGKKLKVFIGALENTQGYIKRSNGRSCFQYERTLESGYGES